jgi:hypothetical protein
LSFELKVPGVEDSTYLQEFNLEAHILSKQALDIEEGKIFFAKEGGSGEEPFEVMSIF